MWNAKPPGVAMGQSSSPQNVSLPKALVTMRYASDLPDSGALCVTASNSYH